MKLIVRLEIFFNKNSFRFHCSFEWFFNVCFFLKLSLNFSLCRFLMECNLYVRYFVSFTSTSNIFGLKQEIILSLYNCEKLDFKPDCTNTSYSYFKFYVIHIPYSLRSLKCRLEKLDERYVVWQVIFKCDIFKLLRFLVHIYASFKGMEYRNTCRCMYIELPHLVWKWLSSEHCTHRIQYKYNFVLGLRIIKNNIYEISEITCDSTYKKKHNLRQWKKIICPLSLLHYKYVHW